MAVAADPLRASLDVALTQERKVEAGEPPSELWDDLAAAGYLVVNIPEEYGGGGLGLTQLWWGARVARTAPVSREVVLNYVAEHSLRLPKSY